MSNEMLVGSLMRLYKKNKESGFTANQVTEERLKSMIPNAISQEDFKRIINQ